MSINPDDILYEKWLKEHKWICVCGLEFEDMLKADEHQSETDHPMKRVKK